MISRADVVRDWMASVWNPDASDEEVSAAALRLWGPGDADTSGNRVSPENIVAAVLGHRRTFPGLRVSVDRTFEDGDDVMAALTWRWGDGNTMQAAVLCRVEDGRIAEATAYQDSLVLCEQLGWQCAGPEEFWARVVG